MNLEAAEADISCLMEEQGPEFLMDRYGVTLDDIEHLAFMAHDDPMKTTVLLHGVLLGLALADLRWERELA